jgi:hypothetical protein
MSAVTSDLKDPAAAAPLDGPAKTVLAALVVELFTNGKAAAYVSALD